MQFSNRAEYGVRLMVELGRRESDAPVALSAIAEAERLPITYLEHIVARLRLAGLVASTRGAYGGYSLARPADAISMDEVVEALEGDLAPMECFSDEVRHVLCSHEGATGRCATKLLWMRVHGGMLRALRETTLADLVAFSTSIPDAPPPAPRERTTAVR